MALRSSSIFHSQRRVNGHGSTPTRVRVQPSVSRLTGTNDSNRSEFTLLAASSNVTPEHNTSTSNADLPNSDGSAGTIYQHHR